MIMTIWGYGKTFHADIYDSLDKETVLKNWHRDQFNALDACIVTYCDTMEFNNLSYPEDAPHNHCEVRSGNINVLPEEINWVEIETFKTKEEAFEYISKNHSVGDRALAVTFIEPKSKPLPIYKESTKYMVGGWCKGSY
jgi:hypothetical protein